MWRWRREVGMTFLSLGTKLEEKQGKRVKRWSVRWWGSIYELWERFRGVKGVGSELGRQVEGEKVAKYHPGI
jgi:hypothetical protein